MDLLDRQAHFISVIASQSIPEIPTGDIQINLFSLLDHTLANQLQIAVNMVDRLENNTTKVHRIGSGKRDMMLFQCSFERIGNQQVLQSCLCIVEVAMNTDNLQVARIFGDHLQPLDIGGASIRIQAGNLHVVTVFESFQRSRTGIPTGRRQNQVLFISSLSDCR